MTVFKTFLKVLNKNKMLVILYTVILVLFGAFSLETSDNSTSFVASKPDIFIKNEDEEKGITKSLISYLTKNMNLISLKKDEDSLDDALFYRDVNFIIYIPKGFRDDFLAGKNPKIQVKSTGDYMASLAQMQLEKYLNVAHLYSDVTSNETLLISMIEETLSKEAEIEVVSNLDITQLSRVSFYYSFMNYSILAGCVYIVCFILSSFHEEKIRKRTIVSSMNEKKYNQILLLSNSLFALLLWAIYILLGFLLLGDIVFSKHGLLFILNSFLFTICALSIAFFISKFVNNKNALNGIVNVVALGSSFLCGSFVPMEYLPDTVLKLAHILPSYWYIRTNEYLKNLETFDFHSLTEIGINMGMIVLFIIVFVCFTNWISNKKRKEGIS